MQTRPHGIIVPIVTPFDREGRLDERALRRLIEHLIQNGVHGIFALGTTGEFYTMTNDECRAIFEISLDQAAGRVPVYGGASAMTTENAVQIARIAEQVGLDAVSVLTPCFISLTQQELYTHYETIAKSVEMPIILYDNKPKTNLTIQPATAVRLAEIPNIIGIKDSTGDFTNTAELIRLSRGMDFDVLQGRDTIIHAGLCYGAKGAVAACANVAPRLTADIYDKFVAGDRQGSLEAQFALAPLRIGFGLGSFPTVIKEALGMIGIDVGECRRPTGKMTEQEREELRKILASMGLLP